MELLTTAAVLGGLYVASNQKGKIETPQEDVITEGFTQRLPGTDIPRENYPIIAPVSKDNINYYEDSNQVTDKYFDQTVYQNAAAQGKPTGENIQQIFSLTGQTMDKSDFTHNNMVPFFGAKIKGATNAYKTHESILDNMQGSGSQRIAKEAVAPLFAPEANMNYVAGAPNQTDFIQSRMNPSQRAANVKPWQEIQVGPGMGEGYSSEGNLGFNAGVSMREMWQPRTVDELRISTNPKQSYGLDNLEGPAQAAVQNRGIEGAVEKYLPDTYYANDPDRWLTTTGLEIAPTSRAIEDLKDVNRIDTTMEYFGNAGEKTEASYTTGAYTAPKRPQLSANPLPAAGAAGTFHASETDYGRNGYKALPNNRESTYQTPLGTVTGAMKAALAPLMDALRPTRKEDVIGNLRPNGNVSTNQVAPIVYNPADRAPTTNRETTESRLDNNHLNVQNQGNGAYTVSVQRAIENQRATTHTPYVGTSGGSMSQAGEKSYISAYNQRNNVAKSYKSRPNPGGASMMASSQNISTGKLESDRENNRWWVTSGGPTNIQGVENYGRVNTPHQYSNQQDTNRIDPNLLSAFKANPYTQSLHSVA
jgi:hypothetical protein